MKKNKVNLLLGTLLPIYVSVFMYIVVGFMLNEFINENTVLALVPFHIVMMFVSIYILVVYIVYYDQNKALTGMEKGVWLVFHFATFGLTYIFFWWLHLSKWETITPRVILKHFKVMK